jgi:hypothetical protein
MSLYNEIMFKAYDKLTNLIPKVNNNCKLGGTSSSWQSPSKLIPKLPLNSNFVTKNCTLVTIHKIGYLAKNHKTYNFEVHVPWRWQFSPGVEQRVAWTFQVIFHFEDARQLSRQVLETDASYCQTQTGIFTKKNTSHYFGNCVWLLLMDCWEPKLRILVA